MTILFRDDFSNLPIGNVSRWPYGPEGEYHVFSDIAPAGAWEEANITYAWRPGTGCWKVFPERGRRIMEQTFYLPTDTPLLVTGSRFWDDYTLAADIRPLSWARPLGLVFRYQHSRSYYLLALAQDRVQLLARDHEQEICLAEALWRGSVDRYYRVQVSCHGTQLLATIDGRELLRVQDDRFMRGRIGLLAEAPARFGDIVVSTDRISAQRIRRAEAQWAAEEASLQARNPRPMLWKRLSTSGFGTDRNLRYGDLDGDGCLEIVVPQGIHHGHGDSYPMINCVTAIDLEGNIRWQLGQPTLTRPHMTGDLCIQAYDWNGDGRAEVVLTQDFLLRILDGRTGQVLQQIPTPRCPYQGPRDPYERVVGDAIYFCDLEGRGERRNLILKDRYRTIWAYDPNLNLLWSRSLNTGHYPIAYDVDGDGHEELLMGYALLDHDGTLLWELPLEDHLDGAYMGPLGNKDAPIRIVMGCSDEGFVLADLQGRILAHQRRGHCQGATIAKLIPGEDVQIATITYWHHPGIVTIYDDQGQVLSEFEPTQLGSILPPIDWAGNGTALLLHNTHPQIGGLFDAQGHRAVVFPDDGHPFLCCDAIDIDGDGRQEIITWDWDGIWVYRPDPPPPIRYHYEYTPIYNNSNYRARWLREE